VSAEAAVEGSLKGVEPAPVLGAVLDSRGVMVFLGGSADVEPVASRLHDQVSGRLRLLQEDIVVAVAVSDPQPSLEHAYLAYEQALRVCRVATAVGVSTPS
jgi:hypothetical protein